MPKRVKFLDRPQWKGWRKRHIGASDAGVIARVSPFSSELELFLDKTGRLPEKPSTAAMEWGLRVEPLISQMVSVQTGKTFGDEQVCLESDDWEVMSATIDGVTTCGEIHEFKTVGMFSGTVLTDDGNPDNLPEHWHLQAQHQMAVAEKPYVIFDALRPKFDLYGSRYGDNEQLFAALLEMWLLVLTMRPDLIGSMFELLSFRVERNQELIDSMVVIEQEFWDNVVSDRAPLEVQSRDAKILASAFRKEEGTIALSEESATVADEYFSLSGKIKGLEEQHELAKAKILAIMQDHAIGLLPDGRELVRKIINVKASNPKPKAAYHYPKLTLKDLKK